MLLEPNAEENIKECIVPSPLQVPSSNKSILQRTCTVYCRGFHTENELKSHLTLHSQDKGGIVVLYVAKPSDRSYLFRHI